MGFDHTIKKGTTSKIIEVMIRQDKDGSDPGQGYTGLAHGSVTASYCREGGTRTAITLAAGTAGDAYSSGKWAEIDSTNQKGLYQIHIPNAALATGADAVTISLQATGIIDKPIRISLIDADLRQSDGYVGSYPTNFSSMGIESDGDLTKVNELNGHTAQTGDNFTRIGATGSGLTSLASQSSVDTIDTNVDAILIDTGTTIPNQISSTESSLEARFDTVDAANVAIAGYIDTEIAAIKGVTDKVDTMLILDGAVWQLTTNALENAPSGGAGAGDATEAKQDQIIATLATKEFINTEQVQADLLVIVRGDSYDGVGNPAKTWDFGKSIDGWTVTFTIRNFDTDAVIHTSTGTASGNVATVALTTTHTTAMTVGDHKFDVQVDNGAGAIMTIYGLTQIIEDQTRT